MAEPAKKDAEKTLRVRMLQSQAGYSPIEVKNEAGETVTVPGPMFHREPKEEYDIPVEEARRMIAAGIATLATPAAVKAA